MKNFSLNERLAILAFTMAFLSFLFAFINPDGLSGVNEKPNFISVISLAEKIKNREDLQVIDLRSEDSYGEFHLPTAEHIPLEQLLQLTELSGDTIVFYSGDDFLSRRLWTLMPDSTKRKSYVLFGGVHDWYERLLYPKLPSRFEGRDSVLNTVHDLSVFYGGKVEFTEGDELMEYYQLDFTETSWPVSKRQNGLVRKGC
ncbi:MAG: rhodanese-like domain-containing protein [Cyclobacteriaceae bacterium]